MNRGEFRTIADFVRRVEEIDKTPALFDDIAAEPLLTRAPSLDGPIEFLAQAARQILDFVAAACFRTGVRPSRRASAIGFCRNGRGAPPC